MGLVVTGLVVVGLEVTCGVIGGGTTGVLGGAGGRTTEVRGGAGGRTSLLLSIFFFTSLFIGLRSS